MKNHIAQTTGIDDPSALMTYYHFFEWHFLCYHKFHVFLNLSLSFQSCQPSLPSSTRSVSPFLTLAPVRRTVCTTIRSATISFQYSCGALRIKCVLPTLLMKWSVDYNSFNQDGSHVEITGRFHCLKEYHISCRISLNPAWSSHSE